MSANQITTVKESFSGPSDILGAAKEAAKIRYGTRNGAWSRWITEAISERLNRDGVLPANAELAEAVRVAGGEQRAAEILKEAVCPTRGPKSAACIARKCRKPVRQLKEAA